MLNLNLLGKHSGGTAIMYKNSQVKSLELNATCHYDARGHSRMNDKKLQKLVQDENF